MICREKGVVNEECANGVGKDVETLAVKIG